MQDTPSRVLGSQKLAIDRRRESPNMELSSSPFPVDNDLKKLLQLRSGALQS